MEEGEGGEDLVVDLVAYEDASIIDALFLARLRSGEGELPSPLPWRYRLDVERGTALGEVLCQQNLELPRINERAAGGPYRFVWGTGNREAGHFTDQLVKLDVVTGEALSWEQEGCFPGEPVFVKRPGASPGGKEDDGVLLSLVLDARNETSFLLVLDAGSLKEEGRATVPHPLPLGFHGQYFGGTLDGGAGQG